MALSDHPRHPLLFGPSPVHRLERLTAHLGGAQIWAKREDCNSGIAFGGNKVRKLEYLAADALAQGCDTLVSIGGVQSNHTRAVAGVAARLGLACVLIQESWVDWPDAVYDRVGNILLSRLMGADVRLVTADFGIGVKESWERALSDVETAGGKPYAIPAGASDHPLGGLGFANWAREVEQQERSLGVFFDTVVVCSVTGSTQAGMVAGFAAADRRRRVIGIDASAKPAETRSQVLRIAQRTGKLLGLDRDLTADHVELDERYHTGTYGIPDRHEPMPNRWAAYLPSSRSATSDARIPRRHRGVAEVAIRAAGVAAGRDGHTLIDRRVYLPVSWAEDRDRCRAAGVPDTVGFATRSELAMNMITAAVRAGCQPAGWPRTRCTATAVSSAPGCASRAGPAPRGAPTDQARADPPNGPSPRAGPCRTDQ